MVNLSVDQENQSFVIKLSSEHRFLNKRLFFVLKETVIIEYFLFIDGLAVQIFCRLY